MESRRSARARAGTQTESPAPGRRCALPWMTPHARRCAQPRPLRQSAADGPSGGPASLGMADRAAGETLTGGHGAGCMPSATASPASSSGPAAWPGLARMPVSTRCRSGASGRRDAHPGLRRAALSSSRPGRPRKGIQASHRAKRSARSSRFTARHAGRQADETRAARPRRRAGPRARNPRHLASATAEAGPAPLALSSYRASAGRPPRRRSPRPTTASPGRRLGHAE